MSVSCIGIEAWGQQLLDSAGADWPQVKGGKAGAVEVAVVRNIIAHGERAFSQRAVNRLKDAGAAPTVQIGASVVLDYDRLHDYRARLKSLLRLAQVGGASVGENE